MRNEKSKISVALITGILIVACATLFRPDIALGSNGDGTVNPLPVDPDFKPRLGTYYYRVDFNNVSIGTASIVIDREGDLYKMQVLAQTIGMVERLYRLRYRGEALMNSEPVSSVETKMQQEVRSSEKDTTIKFQDNGTIKTTEIESKNGATVNYDVRRIQTERFTLDPFSATYLVRGLEWKVGAEKVFDVYPGKYQYELRLKCESMATIDVAGEKRNAFVIVPTVTNLDPDKQAQASKKKQVSTKIYVSADDLKDVLKIEASHTLGNFRVLMVRFDPAENQTKEVNTPSKEINAPARDGESKVKEGDVPAKQEGTPEKQLTD